MNWNKFLEMSDGDLPIDWLVKRAMHRMSEELIRPEDLKVFVTKRVRYIAWRPVDKLDLNGKSQEFRHGSSWSRHNYDIHYSVPGEPPPGASRCSPVTDHTTVVVEMRSVVARGEAHGFDPIFGYVVHEVSAGNVFWGLENVSFELYTLINSDFMLPRQAT